MSALQWFNAVTLAVAATLALTLGVVCLMYAVYLDAAPRLREEWPVVRGVTLVFWVLALAAGAAFYGQRRARAWRGLAQGVLLAALAAGGFVLYRTLG